MRHDEEAEDQAGNEAQPRRHHFRFPAGPFFRLFLFCAAAHAHSRLTRALTFDLQLQKHRFSSPTRIIPPSCRSALEFYSRIFSPIFIYPIRLQPRVLQQNKTKKVGRCTSIFRILPRRFFFEIIFCRRFFFINSACDFFY